MRCWGYSFSTTMTLSFLKEGRFVKFVPIAGQGLSAVLTYGALKYVCEQHIRQCMEVARLLALPAPEPA